MTRRRESSPLLTRLSARLHDMIWMCNVQIMRMNEGVEWALHSCLNLAWIGSHRAVRASTLAAYYDLPTAYLNKQLQALARAGIVASAPGPRGGFRLVKDPENVTLLDVVVAIDGAEEAFRCTQIMASSPGGDPSVDYSKTCHISRAMRQAELVWRRELAGKSLAGIKESVERSNPSAPERTRRWFENAGV